MGTVPNDALWQNSQNHCSRSFGSHNVSGMLLYNQDDYNTNVNSSLIASLPKRKMGVAARLSYDYDHIGICLK